MLQERNMDNADRKLINLLQEGLPLERDPYGVFAAKLGVSREEIVERTGALMREGIIRRLGGVFDSGAMGYSSMLVGAHVPEDIFGDAARFVNAHPGVTHNYRRNDDYNVWFTLIAPDEEALEDAMAAIKTATGIDDILSLRARRTFKINARFDV